MRPEERSRLEKLDGILRSETVREQILPVVARVRAELGRKPEALMTWEPIPLTIYGSALPVAIKSSWIFVLRAGADTGAERHPNSHQRMMAFEGSGDMQVQPAGSSFGEPGEESWESNILVTNPAAALERRWISIPQNVWHRPVVSKEGDWVVISFHTVAAEELIEERPQGSDSALIKQMRYLGTAG